MAEDRPPADLTASGETIRSISRTSSNTDHAQQYAADLRRVDSAPDEAARRRLKPLQAFSFNDASRNPQATTSTEQDLLIDPRLKKKPPLPRRASSKFLPQKGQGFSVDDAVQEVEQARQTSGSIRRKSEYKPKPSTLRRRGTVATTRLPFIDSSADEAEDERPPAFKPASTPAEPPAMSSAIDFAQEGQQDELQLSDTNDIEPNDLDNVVDNNDDDADDQSDAESFTLKDRQEAINETHPFGIRLWKPALYKKGRSIQQDAEGDIHSAPGGNVSSWLFFFNVLWTVVFGWWLALVAGIGGFLCHLFVFLPGCREYGKVLWGFSGYIFYPFGKYVKLIQEEAYADEDEGEGRSITEYEQWQSGDLEEGRLFFGPVRSLIGRHRQEDDSEDESSSLLGREGRHTQRNGAGPKSKRRLFGRGDWNLGRVIFFVFFYGLLMPLLILVSLLCWLIVFTIPMGRVTLILFDQLRRRPLALEFHSDSIHTRGPGSTPSSIILCTYRAVGTKYWKYTIDGTNIFLINLLAIVAFVIFDYWVLYVALEIRSGVTNTIFVFLLALFSIIPLAYFIGQAVASISAQSTMGVGAAVNAFFSTIVEVFLYCVALNQGKARLVEGSLIGSIFAGILLLPGISMCFGAIKRKTQRFNVKSAGVTSTMLLFATICAFSPTLFYQIYGSHEMNCHECHHDPLEKLDRDCRRCFFSQTPSVHDPFYLQALRPYCWFAAVLLFVSYIIGLLFTLRTHAATIWNSELDEKKLEKIDSMPQRIAAVNKPVIVDGGPNGTVKSNPISVVSRSDIRDSQLYKRILGHSLKQAGFRSPPPELADGKKAGTLLPIDESSETSQPSTAPQTLTPERQPSIHIQGMSVEDSQTLVRRMAEMAATAAAVAARDTVHPRKASIVSKTPARAPSVTPAEDPTALVASTILPPAPADPPSGGHDAPNWGRTKSYTVLLSATVAYAIIAEILVSTVDAVLTHIDIDEKFLGITLFALVPNTTEFLNAISFAMNGNIALSMEIGSAYALQVILLQIPALVLFSAVHGQFIDTSDVIDHTFLLLFPQWDMITVILCVFLLSYMYGEGKSNYFKGSILILSYLVVIVGFYLVGFNAGFVADPDGQRSVQPVMTVQGQGLTRRMVAQMAGAA